MTTTICGHEREALVSVLTHWDEPADTGCSCKECAARKDLTDPAKLAEIMAAESVRRGVEAEQCEPFVMLKEQPWPMLQVEDPVYMHKLISADMVTSRARFLRILTMPEGTPTNEVLKALEIGRHADPDELLNTIPAREPLQERSFDPDPDREHSNG